MWLWPKKFEPRKHHLAHEKSNTLQSPFKIICFFRFIYFMKHRSLGVIRRFKTELRDIDSRSYSIIAKKL